MTVLLFFFNPVRGYFNGLFKRIIQKGIKPVNKPNLRQSSKGGLPWRTLLLLFCFVLYRYITMKMMKKLKTDFEKLIKKCWDSFL